MKCFVIMPFGNATQDPEHEQRLTHVYNEWIRPTVESAALPSGDKATCLRADGDHRSGEVISHVIEHLANADIVVADLSGRNANVFYELGVRHALGRRTILITDNISDVPFDLRHLRLITYAFDPRTLVRFRKDLTEAIEEVAKDLDMADNPVRRYLLDVELKKLVSAEAPPGLDVARHLLTEMNQLRNSFEAQTESLKGFFENIIAAPGFASEAVDAKLAAFQGTWRSNSSGTMLCFRFVNGQLLAPYCYGGDTHLTGHYFNFQLVGKTLLAQFKWFDSKISGFALYNVISPTRLEGGWWYDRDIPREVRSPRDLIGLSLPSMVQNNLVMTHEKAPRWAEHYFKNLPT